MNQPQDCPYCGADTRIATTKKRMGKAAPHIFETSQVKCKRSSCGMSGPLFKGENSRLRAVTHWNSCTFIACGKRVGPEKPMQEARR